MPDIDILSGRRVFLMPLRWFWSQEAIKLSLKGLVDLIVTGMVPGASGWHAKCPGLPDLDFAMLASPSLEPLEHEINRARSSFLPHSRRLALGLRDLATVRR